MVLPPLNAGAEKDISMALTCGVRLYMVGASGTVNTSVGLDDTTVELPVGLLDFTRTI